MLMLSDNLPETATRKNWRYVYLASSGDTGHADGKLTVIEDRGSKVRRTIVDTYDVQASPLIGRPGADFLIVKTAHTGDLDTKAGQLDADRVGEVYGLQLFADGNHVCTCTAGNTKSGICLHALALSSAIENGLDI